MSAIDDLFDELEIVHKELNRAWTREHNRANTIRRLLAELDAIKHDLPLLHQRKCWKCDKLHWHADHAGVVVLCPECKSADRRSVKG